MTFSDLLQQLNHLGVEYCQAYEYVDRDQKDVDLISRVLLPFTTDEWCAMCMREGPHYIGGCCGNSSAAQDIMNAVFREGGWIEGRELERVAQLVAGHDPSGPFGDNGKADLLWKEGCAQADPWKKAAAIWHMVKLDIQREVPTGPGKHRSELESAIHTLSNGMDYMTYERFMTRQEEDGSLDSQGKARRLIELARVLPALRIVHDRIRELDVGPFLGFALWDKVRESVATNRMGLCLYETQAEVDAILTIWRDQEKRYTVKKGPSVDEVIQVRPVRITLERGLEFTDV